MFGVPTPSVCPEAEARGPAAGVEVVRAMGAAVMAPAEVAPAVVRAQAWGLAAASVEAVAPAAASEVVGDPAYW